MNDVGLSENIIPEEEMYDHVTQHFEFAIKDAPDPKTVWENWGKTLYEMKRFDEAIEKCEKAESLGAKTIQLYNCWALSLFNLNKFTEAIEIYKKAEELNPPSGFLYLDWGDTLIKINEPELAVEKYKIAANFDDTKLNALLNIGGIYSTEKPEAAIKSYREVLSIDDQNVRAHAGIGIVSYYINDYKAAKESLENACELYKEEGFFRYIFADTLFNLEDYQRAVTEFEEVLKLSIDDGKKYYSYRNMGFALAELNDFNGAIEKFEKAADLRQDDGFLYVYWGDALRDKAKPGLAAEKYKIATGFNDAKLIALLNWGYIYYREGKYEDALKKYREVLSIDNQNAPAHFQIGVILNERKDYQMAKKSFEIAVGIDKEVGLYHYYLADTLLYLNDLEAAFTGYEEALKLEIEDDRRYYSYRNLGFILNVLDKSGDALKNFKKATEFRQDDGFLYAYWGEALSQCGNFEIAEEQYKKSCEFKESKFDALGALGMLNLQQKKYTEAIKFFKDAIEINDTEPFPYYATGVCYLKKGEYSEANKYWERSRVKFEVLEQKNSLDTYSSYYFALVLHYIYGELTRARQLYEKISNDLSYLQKFDKLSLYLELKDNHPFDEDHKYHWKAQYEFKNIEEYLKKEIAPLAETRKKKEQKQLELSNAKNSKESEKIKNEILTLENEMYPMEESYSSYYLGYLYFLMSRFDEAIQSFEAAYEIKNSPEYPDKNSPIYVFSQSELHNALGICYSQLGNHRQAINFIEKVRNEYPGDFEIQNNLANAYHRAHYDAESDVSKARYLDLAESEFEKILLQAPNNIDALIGLGYVKLEKSELRKQDLYQEAVDNFESALKVSKSKKGSGRISNKLKTFILYHLGYAHIKMYENSNKFLDEKSLLKAKNYFHDVLKIDKHHLAAKRAHGFLRKNSILLNPVSYLEKFAHLIISLLALAVFVLSSSSYFWKVPLKDLGVGGFVMLGFGSLVMLIAALSLPQLLKLKVGNIELEKEIKNSVPLKEDFSSITKQRSDSNFSLQGILKQSKSASPDETTKTKKTLRTKAPSK